MGFKPGHKKMGGRQKGTLNKTTETLFAKCERMGIDPFERLLELANDSDKNIALAATREVAQYLYPKRKALEVSGGDKPVVVEQNKERVAELEKLLSDIINGQKYKKSSSST